MPAHPSAADRLRTQPVHARLGVAALTLALTLSAAQAAPPNEPVIETGDVQRFYALYDANGGRPNADQLQHYLDTGSPGLRLFAEKRRTTGARIAEAIAAQPQVYTDARACAQALPRVRARLRAAMDQLGELYPQAKFPPVTIAVGRAKPVGIGSPASGVQIGLEALCAARVLNPDIEDRFVYVIAHEFVHVQQPQTMTDAEGLTVLETSLMEGSAEFVTELIAGEVAYAYLAGAVAGREREIETAFVADMDKTDLSAWLYNTTPDKPGDLGYWVGYRIAKAYYQQAPDKRAALARILTMTDAKAFLAESGWTPGMKL